MACWCYRGWILGAAQNAHDCLAVAGCTIENCLIFQTCCAFENYWIVAWLPIWFLIKVMLAGNDWWLCCVEDLVAPGDVLLWLQNWGSSPATGENDRSTQCLRLSLSNIIVQENAARLLVVAKGSLVAEQKLCDIELSWVELSVWQLLLIPRGMFDV